MRMKTWVTRFVLAVDVSLIWLSFFAMNLHADAPITALAMAPDGRFVVFGSQQGIEVRDFPALSLVAQWKTQLTNVHDLQFSPDGKTLLAAGGSPAEFGMIENWNWSEKKCLNSIKVHRDVVYRVAWSTDGSHWATASGDGECQVFEKATATRSASYTGHSRGVLSLVFLDNDTIASAGMDQTIRLWNCRTGEHLRTLDNHTDTVNQLAVRPSLADEKMMFLGSIGEDRTIRLWQPLIGRLVRFARLSSVPRCLAWTADGQQILIGCNDGRLRIVDFESMDVTHEIPAVDDRIHELVLAGDSKSVLVAGAKGGVVVELNK